MKLANRIGAAVLATAMVGTLLTGCGGGSASTTASTGDGTAAASSTESSGTWARKISAMTLWRMAEMVSEMSSVSSNSLR